MAPKSVGKHNMFFNIFQSFEGKSETIKLPLFVWKMLKNILCFSTLFGATYEKCWNTYYETLDVLTWGFLRFQVLTLLDLLRALVPDAIQVLHMSPRLIPASFHAPDHAFHPCAHPGEVPGRLCYFFFTLIFTTLAPRQTQDGIRKRQAPRRANEHKMYQVSWHQTATNKFVGQCELAIVACVAQCWPQVCFDVMFPKTRQELTPIQANYSPNN